MGLTIQKTKSIVKAMMSDEKAQRQSILVSGPPGVGKTMMFAQIAKEMNMKFEVFLSATMDPTDVAGCPFPVDKDGSQITKFFPPDRLFALTERGGTEPTIALFDDLPATVPQVFAALFNFFQLQMVGGEPTRSNVFLCATGNRAEDKAGANEMPTALNNRFWHVDMELSPEEWREWAINKGLMQEVVGFIGARADMLMDLRFAEHGQRAFYTPRTVEMVDTMLGAVGINHPDAYTAISGCVGDAWATEFMAYLKNAELLIPPEEILKDPKGARLPKEIDVMHATLTSLSYYLLKRRDKGDPKKVSPALVDNCKAVYKYALRIQSPEMAVMLGRDIFKNIVLTSPDMTFRGAMATCKEFNKMKEDLLEYM
jgi:hypothetical protein